MTRTTQNRLALRSRLDARARTGWSRVKGAAVPNTQAAVVSVIAYLVCLAVLHQPYPIFGAIACFLALGFSRNRQPRRVLEIGLGATFGVLVGEVVARTMGFGWWQLLVIMLVTPLCARFIDRSDLMTFQATINAMVVASLAALVTSSGGAPPSGVWRWLDALIGAGIALLATVLIPSSIVSRPRRTTSTALVRLADAMGGIGDGLRDGDADAVAAANGHLKGARDLLTEARTAQSSSADIAALNPALRSERRELAELDRIIALAGRLHVSATMLARQSRSVVERMGRAPRSADLVTEVADALRHLGTAVGHWQKPELARDEAREIARRLAPLEVARGDDWRTTALVSLLRSVVVDLLQLTGLSRVQSRMELVDTEHLERPDDPLDDGGSSMWGTTTFRVIDDEDDGDAKTLPSDDERV